MSLGHGETLDARDRSPDALGMERSLRIRVVYAPTRLAADHLRHAYERVVPVARRAVRDLPERAPVVTTDVPDTGKEQAQ